MSLAPFDIFVVLFLLFAAMWGGLRGILSQITSILTLVASWYVATHYGSLAAPYIPLNDPARQTASVFVLFVVTLILSRIVAKIFCRSVRSTVFKEIDRQLGALLGIVKGILICLVITYFGVVFSENTRAFVLNSQSGQIFANLITNLQKYIPEDKKEAQIFLSAKEKFNLAYGVNEKSEEEREVNYLKDSITNIVEKTKKKTEDLQNMVDQANQLANSIQSFGTPSTNKGGMESAPKSGTGNRTTSESGTSSSLSRAVSSINSFFQKKDTSGEKIGNDIEEITRKGTDLFSEVNDLFQPIDPEDPTESVPTPSRGNTSSTGRYSAPPTGPIVNGDYSSSSITDRPTFSVSETAPPF